MREIIKIASVFFILFTFLSESAMLQSEKGIILTEMGIREEKSV